MDCFDCITKRIDSKKEKEKITCPYCGTLQQNDDNQYPVTYWGEDSAEEYECSDCGKKFWVREWVDRYYEVGTKLDESGYPTNCKV